MTRDEQIEALAAIRARADAATKGPWVASPFGYAGEEEPSSVVVHAGKFDWEAIRYGEADVTAWCDYDNPDDAEFIAHARTDVPMLLDEIERLQAQVADAERRAKAEAWDEGWDTGCDHVSAMETGYSREAKALDQSSNPYRADTIESGDVAQNNSVPEGGWSWQMDQKREAMQSDPDGFLANR